MALYNVLIGEREFRVNLKNGISTVNGEKIDVELVSLNNNGLYLLKRGNQAIEVHIQPISQGNIEVQIGRQRIEARVETFQRRMRQTAGEGVNGDLKAPMPGVVVEVLVEPGQSVSEGETLVVMESMKMKMQMRSSVAGQVTRVFVQPGDEVEKGDLMVSISQ